MFTEAQVVFYAFLSEIHQLETRNNFIDIDLSNLSKNINGMYTPFIISLQTNDNIPYVKTQAI